MKKHNMHLFVPEELHDKLVKLAKQKDKSITAVAVDALTQYVNKSLKEKGND